MWKEEVVVYLNLLPRHAPGGSEGTMEIPIQGSRELLLTEHPVHTSPLTFDTSEYQIEVRSCIGEVFFS
jgi:hypothetical protein